MASWSFGKSHWLSLLAFGGGGGGFSTVTCDEEFAVRPRESVQVALTVIVPGEAPVVFRVAGVAAARNRAAARGPIRHVTGTPSGLVQVHVTVAVPPVCTVVGFAEQLMVGGFLGGSFTV